MHDNMIIWDNLKQVPSACIKTIQAGRLKGMSSIEPQWRLQAMTNQFGPCGIGWKYVITDKKIIEGADGVRCGFVDVELYFKSKDKWSEAIPGTGGSHFVSKEKDRMHTSDEVFKMALTDALSVAMKAIGVASDIYMGAFDGVKYEDTSWTTKPPIEFINEKQQSQIIDMMASKNVITEQFLSWLSQNTKSNIDSVERIPADKFNFSMKTLENVKVNQ